jgi:hypothetical protein
VRAFSTELFPTSHRGTSTGWAQLRQVLGWALDRRPGSATLDDWPCTRAGSRVRRPTPRALRRRPAHQKPESLSVEAACSRRNSTRAPVCHASRSRGAAPCITLPDARSQRVIYMDCVPGAVYTQATQQDRGRSEHDPRSAARNMTVGWPTPRYPSRRSLPMTAEEYSRSGRPRDLMPTAAAMPGALTDALARVAFPPPSPELQPRCSS